MLNPIFIDALKKRLAVHDINWPGTWPGQDNGFVKHPNFEGGPTYGGGFQGGGGDNFQQGFASHPALASAGSVPLPDGQGGTPVPSAGGAAGGLSWLPGWTPAPGYDTSGLTPYNSSPGVVLRHGAYGTVGEDPMAAAIRLRNEFRRSRGNMDPWAPKPGYQFAPGSWQAAWRPGVQPTFDPTTNSNTWS